MPFGQQVSFFVSSQCYSWIFLFSVIPFKTLEQNYCKLNCSFISFAAFEATYNLLLHFNSTRTPFLVDYYSSTFVFYCFKCRLLAFVKKLLIASVFRI